MIIIMFLIMIVSIYRANPYMPGTVPALVKCTICLESDSSWWQSLSSSLSDYRAHVQSHSSVYSFIHSINGKQLCARTVPGAGI